LNSHSPFGPADFNPILTRLQENAGRCIFSQTYDSRLYREVLRFAVDRKPGQQIPKRSITRDVVEPDRQKGHEDLRFPRPETNA
jgi:hypothetical protein